MTGPISVSAAHGPIGAAGLDGPVVELGRVFAVEEARPLHRPFFRRGH